MCCRTCGAIKHVDEPCPEFNSPGHREELDAVRAHNYPDAADDLIAERRLHAAVDDGTLTQDDILLADFMRALLARGVSITLKQGQPPLVEIPKLVFTPNEQEYDAINRFYSQRSLP
jgi:hypothetical protein